MTVKELRTLVNNLDEYIRIPGGIERLRKTILHLAVSGQLVSQDPTEGTGQELYDQIQAEKSKLIREGKLKKQKEVRHHHTELFDIPNSWAWVNIADLYQIRGGKRLPPGEKLTSDKTDFVYIRVTDMQNGTISLGNLHYLSDSAQKTISQYIITSNDLYLSIAGSIGKVGSIPEQLSGANLTENAARLSPFFKIDNSFYKAVIQSDFVQNQFLDKQIKMAQPKLALFRIANSAVPLPPLSEQKRIVQKLEQVFELIKNLEIKYSDEEKTRNLLSTSSLAKLIEGNTLALDHFEEIIKSEDDVSRLESTILSFAVRGQLVPQDPAEGTGQELYDQIQAEKSKLIREGKLKKQKELPDIKLDEFPFEVPESWKWTRLADITNFSIGRTPKRVESKYWQKEYMPWVSIADLNDQGYVDETKEKISEVAFDEVFRGTYAPAGSLLYSFKLTIGKMSILSVDAVHNEAIASLAVYSKTTRDYLFKALKALDPTVRTNAAIKGMTLNSGTLSLLEVPLPPLKEQERIVQKIDQIFELTKDLREKIKN